MERNPLLRQERRRFEDRLRKSLLMLEAQGLNDEAGDLILRLEALLASKMNFYLRIAEKAMAE